jgi:hypothetical protein
MDEVWVDAHAHKPGSPPVSGFTRDISFEHHQCFRLAINVLKVRNHGWRHPLLGGEFAPNPP